jgi:hypothetical protein
MALAAIALSGAAHGCSTPTTAPQPPGGGQTLHLSYDAFAQTVEPVLSRHGCDAGGDCHGAGIRGALRLSPQTAKDVRFDFDQVVLETSASVPESSLILTKPLALAAGGTPHGVKPFASTTDSDYVAIRAWIMNGVNP